MDKAIDPACGMAIKPGRTKKVAASNTKVVSVTSAAPHDRRGHDEL